MRSLSILVALVLLPAAGGARQTATLAVELSPASITVGDPVTVTATLRLPPDAAPGTAATLEGLTQGWGEATVLSPPALDPRSGADAPLVWRFTLTAFRPGRLELPPLVVRLAADPPRTVAGGGVSLEVRSVLPPDGDEIGPMPAAAPRSLPGGAAFFVTAGLLAAAIGAAALALAQRTAGAANAAAPRLPPRQELAAALAASATDEPVAGHATLSRAVRRYLARTFEFPALESTTAQIGHYLTRGPGGGRPDPDLARATLRLLGECDGVKFARRPTDAATLARRREAALELADAIEAGRAPAAPEATA